MSLRQETDVGRACGSPRPSILVVEPHKAEAEVVVEVLRHAGCRSQVAATGGEVIALLDDFKPDLVYVEWYLPDVDTSILCRDIRAYSDAPILVAASRRAGTAAVESLEAGADGFLCKPFRGRELVARIEAALRRSKRGREWKERGAYVVGDLRVDVERHEVWVGDRQVMLPLREFQLLQALVASAGKVWSREALMQRVWGEVPPSGTKSLGVHVSRIRARIEDDPLLPTRLLTVRGSGYTYAPWH